MDTQTNQSEQAPMQAAPQDEHRWLQQLVGEWTSEARMEMGAEASETCRGSESVRSLGGLWIVAEGRGELDAAGKVLTLNSEGPDMSTGAPPGKRARYKDVIEIKSDDHRVLTSHCLGDDGKWQHFMTAEYRRSK